MNINKSFIFLPCLVLTLSSCGDSFNTLRELPVKEADLSAINLSHYEKSKGAWDDKMTFTAREDIAYVYGKFAKTYTKEAKRSNYKTSEEDCEHIYILTLPRNEGEAVFAEVRFYVYSHTDGTMVLPNGDAYAFYGNAYYQTFNEIKEHFQIAKQDYRLTVNGADVSPDAPESGQYKVGHLFSFKVEIVTDVTFHVFLDQEEVIKWKTDGILGGYDYFEFMMPSRDCTLTITGDKYFADRDYDFSELFFWAKWIDETNLKGIQTEDGYIGVDPETAETVVRYSEDERDLSYNLDIIKNGKLRKAIDYQEAEGGWYRKVTFFRDDETGFSFEILNGNYINLLLDWSSSPQAFEFVDGEKIPKISYGEIVSE